MRVLILVLATSLLTAQVTPSRLEKAASEPQNWLTYNGSYASTHYSGLTQITPANVASLELKWVWQARSLEKLETTPLVVDGVMYLTEPPNNIVALDARSGRVFWMYRHELPQVTYPCCGAVNRGLAILGDTLFMGTMDARLIAVDARTGRKKWDVVVADYTKGISVTLAPLVVKDKVIIGTAGGEYGIQGFISAYDAATGKEVWKFRTIPRPGEPGSETWENDGWKHGSGSAWVTGSYDPALNLVYWGTGNPGPDWNPSARPGDNLYTDCVIALDADTGQKKWHFQFTPHDEWDWDAVQVPVLADMEWQGRPRRLMLWGNRNGFFYVLDRTNGEFLMGKPFVKQTWAKGLNAKGRPIRVPGMGPSAEGTEVWPGVQGGTNWYAPSFSPRTKLFYLQTWDDYHGTFFTWNQEYEQGKWYAGGSVKAALPATRREPILKWGPDAGYGAVRALDPFTGERKWEFRMADVSESGILSTASDVVFTGNREGHFFALDAKDGKLLWRTYLGGQVIASPISFALDGKQYISIASGSAIFTFALRD